jgi:hypothetical protein
MKAGVLHVQPPLEVMNTPEQLGLWYLRLNGYFTLPNFIAHAHDGARRETIQMTTNASKASAEKQNDRPKKFIIYVGLGRLLKKPAAKSSSK